MDVEMSRMRMPRGSGGMVEVVDMVEVMTMAGAMRWGKGSEDAAASQYRELAMKGGVIRRLGIAWKFWHCLFRLAIPRRCRCAVLPRTDSCAVELG